MLANRQEALLAAIPDIVMEVDANNVYTWANQAGLEFFGDDAVGRETVYYVAGERGRDGAIQPVVTGTADVG